MSRALVIGASGHIGNAITRELLASGWEVTAASRRPSLAPNLSELAVRHLQLDQDFDSAFAGFELVVDAAAPFPLHAISVGPSTETPMQAAAERTAAFVSACRKHGAIPCLVSAFTTLQKPAELSQAARLARRTHPYFAVKQRTEQTLLRATEDGYPFLILNPTLCLGPWDLKPDHLTLLPNLGTFGQVALEHVVNVVDVRHVARVFVTAVEQTHWRQRLLCSGANTDYATLARLSGLAADPVTVRPELPALSAWLGEIGAGLIGAESPAPAVGLMVALQHRVMQPGAFEATLTTPQPDLPELVAESMAWYSQRSERPHSV